MPNIRKSEFLKDVLHEIKTIRDNATKSEIENLEDALDGSSKRGCVYGQLTGSCTSHRAKELMDKACIRVVHYRIGGKRLGLISSLFEHRTNETFLDIRKFINGENESQMWDSNGDRNFEYYSALEVYILLKGANLNGVLEYLKGNINTLKL